MEAMDEILEVAKEWRLVAPKEDVYCNELIKAYLKGRSDGLEQAQKLVLDKLKDNIDKSGNVAFNLLAVLKKNGFHPEAAYLKVEDWNRFSVMTLIPDKEWGDEKFLEMIDQSSGMEKDASDEYFNVLIVFCPIENNFDEKYAVSDGYLFKYAA
jgi:hypothetical protein